MNDEKIREMLIWMDNIPADVSMSDLIVFLGHFLMDRGTTTQEVAAIYRMAADIFDK
jgi:hypothetical protein